MDRAAIRAAAEAEIKAAAERIAEVEAAQARAGKAIALDFMILTVAAAHLRRATAILAEAA